MNIMEYVAHGKKKDIFNINIYDFRM